MTRALIVVTTTVYLFSSNYSLKTNIQHSSHESLPPYEVLLIYQNTILFLLHRCPQMHGTYFKIALIGLVAAISPSLRTRI